MEAEAQKDGFPKVTNLAILCAQICVGFFSSGIFLYLSNNPLERKLRLREVKQPASGYPGLQGRACAWKAKPMLLGWMGVTERHSCWHLFTWSQCADEGSCEDLEDQYVKGQLRSRLERPVFCPSCHHPLRFGCPASLR